MNKAIQIVPFDANFYELLHNELLHNESVNMLRDYKKNDYIGSIGSIVRRVIKDFG